MLSIPLGGGIVNFGPCVCCGCRGSCEVGEFIDLTLHTWWESGCL